MKFHPIPHTLTPPQLRLLHSIWSDTLRTVASTDKRTFDKLVEAGFVRERRVHRCAVVENFGHLDPSLTKINEATVKKDPRGDTREDLVPCIELTDDGRAVANSMSLIRAARKALDKLEQGSDEHRGLSWHVGYLRSDNFDKLEAA